MTVAAIINIVGLVVVAIVCAPYIRKLCELSTLKLEVGTNDNRLATGMFLALLNDAECEMLVCDDGDQMEESIYENSDVIQAVRVKLEANPRFKMRCMFYSDDETKFRTAFRDQDRVDIKVVKCRRDIHFKIIDDGRKGYVSKHPRGESERAYRSYAGGPQAIRELALRRHITDINGIFQHAV